MKFTITLLLGLSIIKFSMANDEKYNNAMKKGIQSVYEAQTVPDLQNAVNGLQRIADAEKTKWEPFYYISFGYIMMATREGDSSKKDAYLDLAKTSLGEAGALKKDESEIVALEGFIYMMKLTVDPATRGPQYAGLASNTYEKALALNANNPRAWALLAQMQLGTARFFNQAPTDACNNAKKALAMFDQNQSENPLAPKWGKSMTEDLIKNCQ